MNLAKLGCSRKNSTSSQLHSQTSFGSSSFSVQRQAKKAKGSKAIPIQAKLTIGEAGDKYEQEANQVASQVVKQINAPITRSQKNITDIKTVTRQIQRADTTDDPNALETIEENYIEEVR
jgi:hypothetical protein